MDRLENIDFCIGYLLRQNGLEAGLPATLEGKQRLLRALMNVWRPQPLDGEYLSAQDRELQAQLADKGMVEPACGVGLWQGDITRLKVDAIVNAANSGMLGCWSPLHGCIDNAIHSAAGLQLRAECHRRVQDGQWRGEASAAAGEAIVTGGYNLPARHVVHTVGPIVPDGIPTPAQEALLARCYRNCLLAAEAAGCRSIAFCCISTGEYRFPNRLAADIAVDTVREYLAAQGGRTGIGTIVFNVFKDIDYGIYRDLLGKG